jgi:hypothetical protein
MIEDDGAKDVREAWWAELRDEVKAHSRALGCQYVLGYSEHISIEEELVVLHCTGTACNLDLSAFGSNSLFATDVAAVSGGGVVGGTVMQMSSGQQNDDDDNALDQVALNSKTTTTTAASDLLGSSAPVSPISPSRRRADSQGGHLTSPLAVSMMDDDINNNNVNSASYKPPSSAAAAAAAAAANNPASTTSGSGAPASPRSNGVQPLPKYPTLKSRQSAATMAQSLSDGVDADEMALVRPGAKTTRISTRRKRKMQLSK